MTHDLREFLAHAREKHLDYDTIRSLLRNRGWKDAQIDEAIAASVLETPVPTPPGASRVSATSPRDTFLYVLSFVALFTWVIALVTLLFTCIHATWADPAEGIHRHAREAIDGSIRWSIATIVVAFPLFVLLWRTLLRTAARDPARGRSRVRRWLTYLTLFCGAVTILSNVITLFFFAFDGELTFRFLLKVATLFVIAGAVFVYFALTLREPAEATS